MNQNKEEYTNLFKESEMQTKLHKEYIERNNKEQAANLNWAKQANEDYDKIRMGLIDYKNEIKNILEMQTKKNND